MTYTLDRPNPDRPKIAACSGIAKGVGKIQIKRIAAEIGLGEQASNHRVLVFPIVVAMHIIPPEQGGYSCIDRIARNDIGVSGQPHRVDRIVDHDAFLEEQRLTANRNSNVEAKTVVGVEIGKDLAKFTFEEQSRYVGIELAGKAVAPRSFAGVTGKRTAASKRLYPEQNALRCGELQIGE
jgi:hypothetical protein